MKNDKIKYLLCLLFFILLAIVTFRCVLPADYVFSASDLNIGRLAFKKNHLPELITGYFTANQVMGSSGYGLMLFNVLMALLPLEFFANNIYGMLLVFGSLSMVWFLRLWNRGWCSSVFGALIAFWVNSIMLAAGGHAYKMEVLAFTILALCLIERSVRARSKRQCIGFSLLAGLCIGMMMIEQQDVAFLSGLFLAPYALFRLIQVHRCRLLQWVALLAPLAIVALLFSGSTMLKSYKSNIAGAASIQGDSQQKWNFITQWSLVPGEWPDLIASGWGGWGTGRPDGPYWGTMGQSAEWESTGKGMRNFKITSKYIGIIPFLFGVLGVIAAFKSRKQQEGACVLFWSVAGIFALLLSYGKYSLLYKLFYHLPLIGDIRDQSKFLDLFQVFVAIVAAYGLDEFIRSEKTTASKWFALISGALFGLFLLAGLRLYFLPAGQIETFTEMGFGQYAELMVENMSTAWIHTAIITLVCALSGFLLWKKGHAQWLGVLFLAVMTADSLVLTSHYFKATDTSALKRGNVLINYLKTNQGNERSAFVDASGIYNQWLASDGPYHGINLFNIWQMPRMPAEYKEYLGKVGRNQIRLWELSSVKHIAAPASILKQLQQNPVLGKQFKPVLNYQVPTAKGLRKDVLLEFSGAIPRFALYTGWVSLPLEKQCEMLASPSHDPSRTLLVDAAAGLVRSEGRTFTALSGTVSGHSATVKVNADTQSIVRFSQRIQPGWNVHVDGRPAKLIAVDYLSMGVVVPAGQHTVEFRCVNGKPQVLFALAVLVVSLAAGMALVLLPKRTQLND